MELTYEDPNGVVTVYTIYTDKKDMTAELVRKNIMSLNLGVEQENPGLFTQFYLVKTDNILTKY